MKRLKNNWKKIGRSSLLSIFITLPVTSTFSCGVNLNWSKQNPVFYNYEDYMSPGTDDSANIIGQVNNVFTYATFSDLPEFEYAIKNKKTVGGISGDYINAKLASNNYLRKIDFWEIFPNKIQKTDSKDIVKNKLGFNNPNGIYTKKVWDLLESFNYVFNNGDQLWEYMIPYFIQSKVIAFDFDSNNEIGETQIVHNWTKSEFDIISDGNLSKISDVFDIDKNKIVTYKEVFNKLKSKGYFRLLINDYWRDNLMIGSEDSFGNGFTGELNENNFTNSINNFKETIKIITPNISQIPFMSSGYDSLASLIDDEQLGIDVDVAAIYNGDSLYAYYGGANGNQLNKIRIVLPTNSIFLLDGMVVPNYISDNDFSKAMSLARDVIFQGADQDNLDVDNSNAYANFDYVGYTTPFNIIYNNLKDNTSDSYFWDEDLQGIDKVAQEISVQAIEYSQLGQNNIIRPASDKDTTLALDYYRKIFQNTVQ